MKKKLYTLFACAAVSAMVLGGCGGAKTEEPTTDAPAVEQEAEAPIVEDGSLPILSAELQKLYTDAQFIYMEARWMTSSPPPRVLVSVQVF